MTKITIDFPSDLLEEIEDEVDDSITHENRSQLIRTACRAYLQTGGEFEQAR